MERCEPHWGTFGNTRCSADKVWPEVLTAAEAEGGFDFGAEGEKVPLRNFFLEETATAEAREKYKEHLLPKNCTYAMHRTLNRQFPHKWVAEYVTVWERWKRMRDVDMDYDTGFFQKTLDNPCLKNNTYS